MQCKKWREKKKKGEAPRPAERLKVLEKNNLICYCWTSIDYHGTFIASYSEGYQQYTFRIQGSVQKKKNLVKLKAQARATMNVSRKHKCNTRFIGCSACLDISWRRYLEITSIWLSHQRWPNRNIQFQKNILQVLQLSNKEINRVHHVRRGKFVQAINNCGPGP